MNTQALKEAAARRIDELAPMLWDVVMSLYDHPEIAFEEYRSSALLVSRLREGQFETAVGAGGLDTAFVATQEGIAPGSTVAIIAEYDALPGLGHACGHNLIAAAALGAGLAVGEAMAHLPGRLQVIGAPAEEGGGGKCYLVEAGIFDEVDAAMMFHPAGDNVVTRRSLASVRLYLDYYGRPAHAAARPQEGINALEAVLQLFSGVNGLRQHMKPGAIMAGVIKRGGEAANIVPAHCSAEFSVRGVNVAHRAEVLARVMACAEAAALATGCRLETRLSKPYDDILPNPTLAQLFTENIAPLGRVVIPPDPQEGLGSTDMGNVSQVTPSIHPYLATVEPGVGGHTPEFREQCVSEAGRRAMLDAAKGMALTAVDLLSRPELVAQAKAELVTRF